MDDTTVVEASRASVPEDCRVGRRPRAGAAAGTVDGPAVDRLPLIGAAATLAALPLVPRRVLGIAGNVSGFWTR